MAQWFVMEGAEVLGPFTPSEFLAKVRSGHVMETTKVRKDDSAWFVASQVGGLFDAAVKPTVVQKCPKCNATVSKPPCVCASCGNELQAVKTQTIQHKIVSPKSQHASGVKSILSRWFKAKPE